jgi:hypothetical protein
MTLPGAANSENVNTTGTFDSDEVSFRGISKLKLGSGSSTVFGAGDVNNTILAGLGYSSVWGGGSSNDLFIARRSENKAGSSSIFFVDGDGNDTVTNFQFLTSDNNVTSDVVNVLDAVVTGAKTSGQNVVVNLRSDNDNLTINEAVGKDFRMDYLDNGVQKSLVAQVGYDSLSYDGIATYYQATSKNAVLNVSSGVDTAEIWLNNERTFSDNTYVGDIRTLNASAVNGRTTLVGNGYDDVIIAGSENSSMWGSDKGGNDSLVGGAGTDMFWYGRNNGNDTLSAVGENDVVNLYDLTVDDVDNFADWNITSNSVSFNVKDSLGGGSLTILSNNTGFGIKFAGNSNTYTLNQSTKEYTTK